MSVIINDVLPRVQIISSSLQTVFDTNFTVDKATDVEVYARADGVLADDSAQLIPDSEYAVSFIGALNTVRVTFALGRTDLDIVTISRETPTNRENLYTNTNFTPTMLNQDFEVTTLTQQQNKLYRDEIGPRYNVSESLNGEAGGFATPTTDLILPKLEAKHAWIMNDDASAIETIELSGTPAGTNETYILQTPSANLTNSQALSDSPTGFLTSNSVDGVVETRILTPTINQIDISNADGTVGNPVFAIANNPILPGSERVKIPSGTTVGRPPLPVEGDYRFNTDLKVFEGWNGITWVASDAPSDSICLEVNQMAHNLEVGDWIKLNGTNTYNKAQADNVSSAEVIGVVMIKDSVNKFTVCTSGFVTGLSSLLPNNVYFLSATLAGEISNLEPTLDGYVSKPVFISSSATSGFILQYRGEVIGSVAPTPIPVTTETINPLLLMGG